MSFIGDFFKAIANNPNVVNDEEISAELNQFLKDNQESSKRIAFLESNMVKNENTKKQLERKAKEAVKKYKSSNSGSSNKVEKPHEKEEDSREI